MIPLSLLNQMKIVQLRKNIYNENKNEQSTMRKLRNDFDHFEEIEIEENAKNFMNLDCEMRGKFN